MAGPDNGRLSAQQKAWQQPPAHFPAVPGSSDVVPTPPSWSPRGVTVDPHAEGELNDTWELPAPTAAGFLVAPSSSLVAPWFLPVSSTSCASTLPLPSLSCAAPFAAVSGLDVEAVAGVGCFTALSGSLAAQSVSMEGVFFFGGGAARWPREAVTWTTVSGLCRRLVPGASCYGGLPGAVGRRF